MVPEKLVGVKILLIMVYETEVVVPEAQRDQEVPLVSREVGQLQL